MKKSQSKIVLLIVFVSLVALTDSYGQFFQKGTKLVNVGIGFGGGYGTTGFSGGVPPISGSFEIGVTDKIGVGGILGYSIATSGVFGSNFKATYFLIGARGAYHFEVGDNLDLYAGAMLGYNSVSYSDTGFGTFAGSGIVVGIFGGGRYMFSENIGAFAELGYSIAVVNVGVTFKF